MSNVLTLHNTKTDVSGEFEELIPEIRIKIADYMFSRVCTEDAKSKRKYKILDMLREVIPVGHKHLLSELEELYILGILPICDSSYIINNINTIINN